MNREIDDRAARDFAEAHQRQMAKGMGKYGKPVHAFNGRDAGNDCLEELTDAMVYLAQLRTELDAVKDMHCELIRLVMDLVIEHKRPGETPYGVDYRIEQLRMLVGLQSKLVDTSYESQSRRSHRAVTAANRYLLYAVPVGAADNFRWRSRDMLGRDAPDEVYQSAPHSYGWPTWADAILAHSEFLEKE